MTVDPAQQAEQAVDQIEEFVRAAGGLAVLSTIDRSGAPHSSLVNAGILPHPHTGEPVIALVAIDGGRKLRNLERDPRAVVLFRDGYRWIAAEGEATIVGPDHPHPDFPPADLPGLLRDTFRIAGGGEHSDWAEYDRVMAAERRVLVLIGIGRTYGNRPRATS
ncbi:MAG TPA: TIGR03618 family F420-dependent PPOX class oxidoreductase [Actinocrinis sp.]|nr:TIGR03618 family F420-dependent PPOX class oxidoreductase [Actinocrinis sp.]